MKPKGDEEVNKAPCRQLLSGEKSIRENNGIIDEIFK